MKAFSILETGKSSTGCGRRENPSLAALHLANTEHLVT